MYFSSWLVMTNFNWHRWNPFMKKWILSLIISFWFIWLNITETWKKNCKKERLNTRSWEASCVRKKIFSLFFTKRNTFSTTSNDHHSSSNDSLKILCATSFDQGDIISCTVTQQYSIYFFIEEEEIMIVECVLKRKIKFRKDYIVAEENKNKSFAFFNVEKIKEILFLS